MMRQADDDLSVRERAEFRQLWNKAPALREEGELFLGLFKRVEDGKRVLDRTGVLSETLAS